MYRLPAPSARTPSAWIRIALVAEPPQGLLEALFQDEAGVVIFVHAIGDFGVAVGICVGMFLAREAQDNAGVIFSRWRESVRLLPCSDFEARPFAP